MLASVAIRVDSSRYLGAGHLMRCLALADGLVRRHIQVYFVCRDMPGHWMYRLRERHYPVYVLPLEIQKSAWEQDAVETIRVLEHVSPVDCLIVDHYDLDRAWEERLRPYAKQIVVLDDLANRQHECDGLLDPTLGRQRSAYQALVPAHARLLLGPEYALLAQSFSQKRLEALRRRHRDSVETVLVSMGGTDSQNVTAFVVDVLQQAHFNVDVRVMMPAHAPHRVSESARIQLEYGVEELADKMIHADLAIGAGGTTSWERCCMGLPTLLVVTADNQLAVAQELYRAGAIQLLGKAGALNTAAFIEIMRDMLHHPDRLRLMSAAAASICDGYGVNRMVAELQPQCTREGAWVRCRKLQASDSAILFQWQHHPSTRQFGRYPYPPGEAEHNEWLQQRLTDPQCVFHLLLYNDEPAGVLRLDRKTGRENVYEVSILTAPHYRRLGVAAAGLKLIRYMFPDWELHAEVLSGNEASHALFQSVGYRSFKGIYIHSVV